MTHLTLNDTDKGFSEILDRVAEKKERIILQRHGKEIAVLVPVEDLALLEEMEDRLDIEEAERRLADPTDTPIPYEQARKELGLD